MNGIMNKRDPIIPLPPPSLVTLTKTLGANFFRPHLFNGWLLLTSRHITVQLRTF